MNFLKIRYKKQIHLLFFTALLLAGTFFAARFRRTADLGSYMARQGAQPLRFSQESGYYPDGLTLEITVPAVLPTGAAVHYTLDGTEPGPSSPRYDGPLKLDGLDEETAFTGVPDDMLTDYEKTHGADYDENMPASKTRIYTVRARICMEDPDAKGEVETDVQYGVYCVGRGLFPCGDEYVICVDTDPEGLISYETGILVGGKDLDDYDQSKWHGNYMLRGEEWTRACHVSVFDGSGELLTDVNAGVTLSGSKSRRRRQKSFNLSFGEPYGQEGERLELDIFPDRQTADCAHVDSYTHLLLRARSQMARTFRETLVGRLADESGARLVTECRAGLVFVNGSFYSLAELAPTFSSSLIARRFDLPDTQHIEKEKGKEEKIFESLDVTDLFAADLTREENRRALEAAVDMDDYLLYYAVNVLTNNLDWPLNNVEAWRWTGDSDPARPYTDGRLRFLIFDADMAYDTDEDNLEGFGTDNFVAMMENIKRGYGSRFRDVMRAEVYRDKFVTILCDLMGGAFDTDHVLALMEEAFEEQEEEYRAYYTADYMQGILEEYAAAREEAASRNDEIRQDLADYFDLTETYRMELSASPGVCVTWNNMYLAPDSVYGCDYYRDVKTSFRAEASPGWRFDHWEVNGERVSGSSPDAGQDTSVISVDGSLLQDGICSVRAVAVPEEGERLIIAEISSAGERDWIRLCNAGTVPVSLSGYCISDDAADLRKYRLPRITLAPGESCRINGSKNSLDQAICTCTFSLRRGETLYLTPDEETGSVGDSLFVPYMSSGSSYGRRDDGAVFAWFDRRQ